jgi:hypothetical protein
MLCVYGFERIGLVIGDMYILDPNPLKTYKDSEHGVRLELRLLHRGEPRGSIYSSRPIEVGRPVWRVDLLESVDSEPGSFDRTHHHTIFDGWNPSPRVFVDELSAAPFDWLAEQLSDIRSFCERSSVSTTDISQVDARGLSSSSDDIVNVTRKMMEGVRQGELGREPDQHGDYVRAGWL